MKSDSVFLRALEPSDIEILFQLENNSLYWKYSNRTEPFSKALLENYIAQQSQDIFEVKQKRFVLASSSKETLGFVDLFDFEPIHRRAGVGILIKEGKQGNGFGKTALNLLATYAQKHLHIHCLYTNIALENKPSIRVFEACGYQQVGLKKAWNFYEDQFHDEYLYQKLFH
ncbi:GNAT family protein [Flavobacteriaceae bacterium]|nr:GNAT family N-acetyltransferase [Flavobacteriaceae bacterium]MDC0916824.1 GNAT family protein [Flavobacteriaceae bacterium]